MATTFQRQALHRKLIYAGIIIGLLTGSLLLKRVVIEPQALYLQLREKARGEVELTSSAVRLTLTGSRGFASCVLWQMALERQKKHQWNEMEVLVRSITKLQPHFVTPWLFQSWNLAFNVAVECDRPRDKYFYVSRGLELLAEGERRNRGALGGDDALASAGTLKFPGNPDMRFNMGFFYQLKIAHSDESNAMKCLYDMSCIDPIKRDPDLLRKPDPQGRTVVDLIRFEDFCRKNPRLVRRLREKLRCATPKLVVAFLSDNKDIPSRYGEPSPQAAAQGLPTPLRAERERFPILPPPVLPGLPNPAAHEFVEDLDVLLAAQAWYIYAQEPLPPPPPDPGMEELEFDPVRHRLPKMAAHIFRTYPARAQAFSAEHRQEEGWFDEEGWLIPDWFEQSGQQRDRVVAVGGESKYQSGPAWQKAYVMYLDYGQKNHVYLTPEQRLALEQKADLYRRTFQVGPGQLGLELRPSQRSGGLGESHDAHRRLYWNDYYRSTTNFDHFLNQCAAERTTEVLAARKLFFQAARKKSEGAEAEAMALYEEAVPRWLDLLLKYTGFRGVPEIQQETYETQLSYLRLLQDQKASLLRPVMLGMAQFGLITPSHGEALGQLPALILDKSVKVTDGNSSRDLEVLDQAERRRIIPIRKARGPYEFIYLYQTPGREALQTYLLGLTQMTQQPPLLLADYLRDWQLVAYQERKSVPPGSRWQPLISDDAISAARQQLNLPPFATETAGGR